jgi:hypothetical protein
MAEVNFNPPTIPESSSQTPVDFGPAPSLPSPSTASARASMFEQGLNPVLKMDKGDMDAAISSGKELNLRTSAAAQIDSLKFKLKQQAARVLGQMPDAGVDAIQKLSEQVYPTNPTSVAEEAWGQAFTHQVSLAANNNMAGTTYADAQKAIPRIVEEVNRRGGVIAAQNQYITKWVQDAEDEIKKQNLVHGVAEAGLAFLPFYREVVGRSVLNNIVPWSEKLGFGDYMERVFQKLTTMPFPQFTETVDAIAAELIRQDPHAARDILGQLLGTTTSDKILNNLSTAFDVSSLPGTGLVMKGLSKLPDYVRFAKEAGEVTADSLKSLETPARVFKGEGAEEAGWSNIYEPGTKEWYEAQKFRTAEAAGDMKEAGVQKAAEEIINQEKPNFDTQKSDVERLTSNFRLDVDAFTANIGKGGRELKNRIMDKFGSFDSKFKGFLEFMRRVQTLPDVIAGDTTARVIEKTIRENYRGVNNSIQDVVYKGLDPIKNTYRYELQIFSPDGAPFQTNIQALANRNLNGLLDARVEKEGMGWKLVREINLDENMAAIRDLIAKTDEAKIQPTKFDGWLDAVHRFRTPKEILSVDENRQRELATHLPNVLLGIAKDSLEELARVPKGGLGTTTRAKWKQFQRAVNHAKQEIDPKTGDPGHWFEDGAAMDKFYLQNFNRLPDDIEKQAYVATVRNIEMNRVLDTIRLYDNKAKWGGEQHRLSFLDKDDKRVYSDFFEGRIERDVKAFNIASDATVYVKTGKGEGVVYRWGTSRNPIMKKIESGELKAVQVWNPTYRPLQNFGKTGNSRIQWVITDNLQSKALDWENQIPRRGGGHFVYDYNYYIKQAKISREDVKNSTYHWLEGDTTVMPMTNSKLGKEIVKHLNAVRLHLLNGREDLAKAYHYTNQLPMDWSEHLGWYKESHEGGQFKPARLSMQEPFHLVPKDLTVSDMPGAYEGIVSRYGKGFRDDAREGNPARKMQVQYTGERDAREVYSIRDLGSRDNPLYLYEPAAFADPIHVMNRAMQRSVKSIYNVDMKNYAMNHWLAQAVPYLDMEGANAAEKLRTALASSSWHFNQTGYVRGTPQDVIKRLENAKHQIKQFVGIPSDIETQIHSITQNLADVLYGKGFKKIPDWLLHEGRDPAAYLRSIIVHMKLGLFNPTAFFVQASTHLNIWGIAGAKHAGPGTAAMMGHLWGSVNMHPGTLAEIGKKMEGMGWRPGEWEEAFHELNRRGFTNIGHTHAFVDAPYQTKVLQTKAGSFLDWGHFPFRNGARSVRTAAWYTAYHEWRHGSEWRGVGKWDGSAHAAGKLNIDEWDRVMARAADLDHNMSRAGNARIQSGLMSFPLQFQSYHLRLLELMTGKRLTIGQKARLFGTTSLFYGIPIGGIGVGLPLINQPIQDAINKHAQIGLGYLPNKNFFADVVMRGLPDAMLGQIFGDQYNVAERWGPGKFDVIDKILEGQVGWWEVLTGATGSTLKNLAQSATPLSKAGLAIITRKSDDFKLTTDDWLRPFEEVSSMSDLAGFIRTIETGNIMSRDGTFQSDVSKAKWRNAIMRYGVGLTPESITSAYDNYRWTKAEQNDYKDRERRMIKEIHAMIDARNNNDPSAAEDYLKRAMSWAGDMPVAEVQRIMAVAVRSWNKPFDTSVDEKRFAPRSAPVGQEAVRGEILRQLREQGH